MDYVEITPKQRDEMLRAVGASSIDDLLRPLLAEGDAQREGHQQGEGEDPEHGLRLAQELAQPGHGQLDDRDEARLRHRAGGDR